MAVWWKPRTWSLNITNFDVSSREGLVLMLPPWYSASRDRSTHSNPVIWQPRRLILQRTTVGCSSISFIVKPRRGRTTHFQMFWSRYWWRSRSTEFLPVSSCISYRVTEYQIVCPGGCSPSACPSSHFYWVGNKYWLRPGTLATTNRGRRIEVPNNAFAW